MAKTTNPLFSLAASGTVSRIIFRQTGSTATARARTFRRAPAPSPAQVTVRADTRAAALAWRALDPTERAEWAARGVYVRFASNKETSYTLHHGYALWLQEWKIQRASAERLPMMPT